MAEDRGYSKKSMKISKKTKDELDELIKVKGNTHEALTRRGRKGDSYDDIIKDLLKENKELNEENKKLKKENKEYREALGIR